MAAGKRRRDEVTEKTQQIVLHCWVTAFINGQASGGVGIEKAEKAFLKSEQHLLGLGRDIHKLHLRVCG
jgi:hypothetical protein